MKTQLSSSWTTCYLIGPLIIGAVLLLIELIGDNDNLTLIIPIVLILTSMVLNIFLVHVNVDSENLYLRNFIVNRQYRIQQIDKIGELGRGLTIINIHRNNKFLNTFLIINAGEFFDELDGRKEIDVYGFLIKKIQIFVI